MLRNRFYFAFALVTAAAAAAGCTGNGDTAGSGGHGSTSSSNATSSTSSGMGGAHNCMPGLATVLAANQLYVGEMTDAWKKLGFNIDGKVSTAASNDVCKPVPGGTAAMAYPDGDNGIDNSFGKNVLPMILGFDKTFATDINTSLQTGAFTMMLKMECLPPTGDVSPLVTKLFGGTPLGATPKFDGTDKWPVAPELLSDPMDPDSSKVLFLMSSVTGSLFDSGKDQTFILTVPLKTMAGSTSITLTVHAARVTMNLAADRKSATGGIIGGVLNTDEFIKEVSKVVKLNGFCALFPGIESQMRQASDILTDGSQDSAKTCDGISIGIGFDLKEVQLGVVGPATAVGASCP